MSWAPYGSNMKDTEIGINSNVAKAIGKCESTVECRFNASVSFEHSVAGPL